MWKILNVVYEVIRIIDKKRIWALDRDGNRVKLFVLVIQRKI